MLQFEKQEKDELKIGTWFRSLSCYSVPVSPVREGSAEWWGTNEAGFEISWGLPVAFSSLSPNPQ